MNYLTYAEFVERQDEFAATVARMPDVSPFCSSPFWQLAAHDSLHGRKEDEPHFICERDGNWLVFVHWDQAPANSSIWFPFESAWMFGCPFAGNSGACVQLLRDAIAIAGASRSTFCVSGIVRNSEAHLCLLREGKSTREFSGMESLWIDLSGGVEAWLGRRSKKFRKTLRRGGELAAFEIEDARSREPEEVFRRMMSVQEDSYKRKRGEDIFEMGDYVRFYRDLLARLSSAGGLRVWFARREGRDVAYLFGGVWGETFRGLQMSYIEEVRHFGIGNRLQWEALLACAGEGLTRYDLGMHAPYKERWADRRDDFVSILLDF